MLNLPWGKPGRFWKGNLHCHSTLSDGQLPLADVVAAYRAQGYDFVAVTEHWLIADTRPWRDDGFTTLLGAELDAPGSAIGETWYINAVGLPLDFPLSREESIPTMARRARGAGAFVAVACPAWCGTSVEDVLAAEAVHAVESYSEVCAWSNDRGDSWFLVDGACARGRRVNGLAVDDAHFTGFPDAFAAWVEVRSEDPTPEGLLGALIAGHYYSTQGPAIHDVRLDGDELSVSCSPATLIVLSGRGANAEHTYGLGLTSARLPLASFQGAYCRLTVVDGDQKRAWSNPIWLD